MTAPNYRTDDLPAGAGPFIIENDRHQLWVVTREFVWRVGGGEGRPHSDEIRLEVGPWRYVSVPIPADLQSGQANSSLSPELRRSLHVAPTRFAQRTENEVLRLDALPATQER